MKLTGNCEDSVSHSILEKMFSRQYKSTYVNVTQCGKGSNGKNYDKSEYPEDVIYEYFSKPEIAKVQFMMTVKKPDYSDDATDKNYIYDKTDEDYPEDAIHEVHIYDETNEDYTDEDFFYDKTDEDYSQSTIDEDCAHPQFPRWLQSAASIVLLQWPPYCLQ